MHFIVLIYILYKAHIMMNTGDEALDQINNKWVCLLITSMVHLHSA